MKDRGLSDELIRYLNNEMAGDQASSFLGRLHLKELNGPDDSGYIRPNERMLIYDMIMNHEKGRADHKI